MAGPSPALEVLPTGWVTFASHIDTICHHYEGSCTTCASPHTTNSPCAYSHTLLTSNPEANLCVYKFDVMTGMILTLCCFLSNYPTEGTAKYIQDALQLKSFKWGCHSSALHCCSHTYAWVEETIFSQEMVVVLVQEASSHCCFRMGNMACDTCVL